jgi:aminomethyltransferase
MKETAFLPIHRELGAKIVEFAGYLMPVSYAGIIEEHRAVRTRAGLFDVSHMGEFHVTGPDAQALVQKVTTNDVSRIAKGKVQYSAMCMPDGGIVDDLLVYHMGDAFMLVVNAANLPKDLAWIRAAAKGMAVEVRDGSDATSLLAVQGPRSHGIMAAVAGRDLSSMEYYSWTDASVAGVKALVSRTGYTGEAGYEIYFDSSPAAGRKVWDAIMAAGEPHGIRPVGLGARDTLRLEMGYCLYGNDIDETTNPLEAGLGWITKLSKGDFIGREALVSAQEKGLARKLSAFTLDEPRAFPRQHHHLGAGGREVGEVTSGTLSPTLERGIGMGYLPAGMAAPGSRISVMIRDRAVPATTVKPPFVPSHV